jgi:hypothetical protein
METVKTVVEKCCEMKTLLNYALTLLDIGSTVPSLCLTQPADSLVSSTLFALLHLQQEE